MAPSTAILSQTLRSITITKIRELQKQRDSYGVRTNKISKLVDEQSDLRERVKALHKSLQEWQGLWNDAEFCNIVRWANQAQYDPSCSEEKLVACEKELDHRLAAEGRKLELADLYSRLMTEWIEQNGTGHLESEVPEGALEDSDSFEMIQSAQRQRLEQLREKFAKVVFEPLETDEDEIQKYLRGLFNTDKGKAALKTLKQGMKYDTSHLNRLTINDQSLKWTIKALQKNDLLNDEKKAILEEFLHDEAVLNEIRDVLNMRLADIDAWSWDLGDEGMPVVPRQSLNGKWRVMVDDDIMQALLTHHIGTVWAVKMKNRLSSTAKFSGMWKRDIVLTSKEREKRRYFTNDVEGGGISDENTESQRSKTYSTDFFLAPLPSKEHEEAGAYDDDEEDPEIKDKKSPREIKQLLLRTLATEVLLRQAFDGQVAVVQSDFQWFATGISHSTIFATLRFLGTSDQVITFIRKVLEPPLDMLDGKPVRTRKRGLPMAHIFEKLFGEVVLFFMDIAVNQKSRQILYRFHDDLWLVGKPARCAQAWKAMEEFAKVMGLEFNFNKTGSVYLTKDPKKRDPEIINTLPKGPVTMSFLTLDPESGEWVINQDHVQQHVEQLRKQLAEAKSVLEWIKTWNSCIGRFFGYTFGEPAQCFGKPHIKAILETHERIQKFLFDGKDGNGDSISSHLKQMISSRFDVPVASIPDAFLYLPDSFGGLGVKNPFINLCLAADHLYEDPMARVEKFLDEERASYDLTKKCFETMSDRARRKLWKTVFDYDKDDQDETPPSLSWADAQTFPSYEEMTKHREVVSLALCTVYGELLQAPWKGDISMTKSTETMLRALADKDRSSGAAAESVYDVVRKDPELVWLLEYYRDDLLREVGGLQCVQKDLLPLGVLSAMRKKKVTWQMVL